MTPYLVTNLVSGIGMDRQVNFTFDEIHAFSEHVTWCIYEQDQPVDELLQSFIDKVLYPDTIQDNSPYDKIPQRY